MRKRQPVVAVRQALNNEYRISNVEISKNSSSLLANRYSAFDIQSWQIQSG
jgi:hypothetical protein